MKENKDAVIQIRLTPKDKALFILACATAGDSITGVLGKAIKDYIKQHIEEEE